jgi:hypothetical protein
MLVEVISGYFRIGQVMSGNFRLAQVKSLCVRLGHVEPVISGYDLLIHVRTY